MKDHKHKARYGEWAGQPRGNPPDLERCVEEVHDSHTYLTHQCRRKKGHGPEGAYCKQHAKRFDREV